MAYTVKQEVLDCDSDINDEFYVEDLNCRARCMTAEEFAELEGVKEIKGELEVQYTRDAEEEEEEKEEGVSTELPSPPPPLPPQEQEKSVEDAIINDEFLNADKTTEELVRENLRLIRAAREGTTSDDIDDNNSNNSDYDDAFTVSSLENAFELHLSEEEDGVYEPKSDGSDGNKSNSDVDVVAVASNSGGFSGGGTTTNNCVDNSRLPVSASPTCRTIFHSSVPTAARTSAGLASSSRHTPVAGPSRYSPVPFAGRFGPAVSPTGLHCGNVESQGDGVDVLLDEDHDYTVLPHQLPSEAEFRVQASRFDPDRMTQPKCRNVVVYFEVKNDFAKSRLQQDNWLYEVYFGKTKGVKCPSWLKAYETSGRGRKRGSKRNQAGQFVLSDEEDAPVAKTGKGKAKNHYMLAIDFFKYTIFPAKGSVSVSGVPTYEAVPVAIQLLCEKAGGINPLTDIAFVKTVNFTFTGRLCNVSLYQLTEREKTVKFIRRGLEFGAAAAHGLVVHDRTSKFPGIKITCVPNEYGVPDIKGTITLFNSGAYNIVGVTSTCEAHALYARLCAAIGTCWTTGPQGTPSAPTVESCWAPYSAEDREVQVLLDRPPPPPLQRCPTTSQPSSPPPMPSKLPTLPPISLLTGQPSKNQRKWGI